MVGKLSYADSLIIKYLLEDDSISATLIDAKDKDVYKRVDIAEDGTITFGKTSIKWWNRLIGCEKIITFNEFAIKTANAISGQKNNKNDTILNGLLTVIAAKGITNEDYGYVVDQLLVATKFGMNSKLKCRCLDIWTGNPNSKKEETTQDFNVHIKPRFISDATPVSFPLNQFGDTINAKLKIIVDGFVEK